MRKAKSEGLRFASLTVAPLLALSGETVAEFAARVDASPGAVYRAMRNGLTIEQADRWAVEGCGRIPWEVWGGDVWVGALDEYERVSQ